MLLQYLDTIIAFAVVMLGLSLIITILNQIISSFLSFRGSNLRWGIGTMLSTLDPTLQVHAKEIANQILSEQVVSDSVFAHKGFDWLKNLPLFGRLVQRWKLASAIGPDTLVRVLTDISNGPKSYAPKIKTLLDKVDPAALRKLGMAYEAFRTPPGVPGVVPAQGAAAPTPTLPSYGVKIDDLLKELGNSAQQSVGSVEAWFNVTMNRVTQRFTMKVRIWTVIFAFVLAFSIHLDSVQMANNLFKNPALRQKLVDSSSAMLNEAAAVLGTPGGGTENTTSPEVLQSAMKELIDKTINKETEAKPELLGPVPADFTNLAKAEEWLKAGLKEEVIKDEKRWNEIVAKYKSLVILGLREKAKDVIGLLKDAGIEIAPRPLPTPWYSLSGWRTFFAWDSRRNFVGILLTAALLSLGAPFWYNTLKSLTNLRPMVATRHDQQRKDAA